MGKSEKLYAPNFVCREFGQTHLLLDPDTPNWVSVNKLGKEILELCNGENSVEDITEILCERYNDNDYESSLENIKSFLNLLKEKSFLSEAQFSEATKVNKKKI